MTTTNALPTGNTDTVGVSPTPPELLQEMVKATRMRIAGASYEVVFEDSALGVLVLLHRMTSGRVCLLSFAGRRCKPDVHYSFKDAEKAKEYQDRWYAGVVASAQRKAKNKAETAAATSQPQTALVVGDVLVASWGYEQTNYDYYQVTRLVGARSVEIRELAQQTDTTGFLQGDCVPVKNKFAGEPMVKRVNTQGSVKVRDWGVWASKHFSQKVGGVEVFKPNHYTAYA
jgi:hypothetical protein